jgi:aarF domain-containing kinase
LVSEGMQHGLFADFLQEANNAERTAKSFAHKEGILVPRVVKDLTTKRILTMEFMEGCKIDDVQALEKAGIDPEQVSFGTPHSIYA